MSNEPLRVLGYVRRSTDKQAMSPETQARRLCDAADVLGWELTIREEDAASAKTLDGRPVLAAALSDLDHGQADALAVAALDRLARSTRDFADILDRAEREAWAVVCLDLGVDTSTDSGRLVADIRAAVAQWERRIIASRTREGMATIRATTGKHMGRPSAIPPTSRNASTSFTAKGPRPPPSRRCWSRKAWPARPRSRSPGTTVTCWRQ